MNTIPASIPADNSPEPAWFTIRRAGPADAPALAALFRMVYKNSSHPFRSADAVEVFLADRSNFQFVAEDSGQVIASMAMVYNQWNDSYELGRALTHAEYRRHGFAARLIQSVVDCVADQGGGELFFGFPRVRRIVDLCRALQPGMTVVGHDAGRNVVDGFRETHAIVCGILRRGRFVHVAPPAREIRQWRFLDRNIYAPLGLFGTPGQYPDECFVGDPSRGSQEFDGWTLDYDQASRSLEIVAGPRFEEPAEAGGRVDRLMGRFDVEHASATVLADEGQMIRALVESGFEVVAYLPAWYKAGKFRYDCVQLARRRRTERPREQDLGPLFGGLDFAFRSSPFRQQSALRQAA